MPIFNYKARDKFGILIKGKVEERTREALAEHLQNSGYTIVSIWEQSKFQKDFETFFNNLKQVKKQEIIIFTRQLSGMLAAGLPLLTCLSSLASQTPNRKFAGIIEDIKKDVEAGSSLSEAMFKHPQLFPEVYVNMINVGEVSGKLEEVLQRLADLGFQQMEIKAKIKAAMIYPVFLFGMMILISIGMLTWVLPRFVEIFEKTGKELPFFTRLLLNASYLLKNYWWAMLVGIIVAVVLFKKYLQNPKGKFNFDKFLLSTPVLGKLIMNYNIATMTQTLGNLLKSGVSLVQCLTVTENTVRNSVLKVILVELRENVVKGKGISEQLRMSGVFPPMVIQMISAGEQTGKLDEMLTEISEFYTVEVDYSIQNMTSVLGPLMLLIMAILVGSMALAVLIPIFSLVKIFKKK
ncbi:MAG: type II secretion system F family protein [Candidatus Aureabacteria bacterium]|nr:type II secretion system F family protein [Candidatus Auribacterota bacterium]